MSLEKQSLKEIINFRLQKLNKLRDSGIDPYPHNFKPTNYSNQLKTEFKSYENKEKKQLRHQKVPKYTFTKYTNPGFVHIGTLEPKDIHVYFYIIHKY